MSLPGLQAQRDRSTGRAARRDSLPPAASTGRAGKRQGSSSAARRAGQSGSTSAEQAVPGESASAPWGCVTKFEPDAHFVCRGEGAAGTAVSTGEDDGACPKRKKRKKDSVGASVRLAAAAAEARRQQ
jgi:hypothetical protein